MDRPADFFVSYTSTDRAWAEWIAWQLEAEGYQVVVQAWDFTPGQDWTHKMQHAIATAQRVVVVLSPAYLGSAHGEAEWRGFYADDPSGERGLLLVVRVEQVKPPGLLKTRVYVDLVDQVAADAQRMLLAAARGTRGKPAEEPEFPGRAAKPVGSAAEAPRFPGELPPVDGEAPSEELTLSIRADDARALRGLLTRISTSLRKQGFSESDIEAFEVSLRELVDNVVDHVRPDDTIQLELNKVDRLRYTYQEGLDLLVIDGGEGFDFNNALLRLEAELLEHGIEHGLLRAYRLGSSLAQVSTNPHMMGWMRERIPQTVPTTFGGENVVPFVFSYRQEAVRISQSVHTFFQFQQYLKRSQAFLNLVFDPLQRPARKYVGIEVVGQGWTGALSWERVLDRLLVFAGQNEQFDKQFLLFADTGPSEQSAMRQYCKKHAIVMFEDPFAIGNIKDINAFRASQKAQSRRRRRK